MRGLAAFSRNGSAARTSEGGADQVDLDHPFPRVSADLVEVAAGVHAGVGHDRVDQAAVLLRDGADRALDGRAVGHVHEVVVEARAWGGGAMSNVTGVPPWARDRVGDRGAQTRRAAGDDDGAQRRLRAGRVRRAECLQRKILPSDEVVVTAGLPARAPAQPPPAGPALSSAACSGRRRTSTPRRRRARTPARAGNGPAPRPCCGGT